MDRIQFVNSINHNDKQLAQFLVNYIDQYMVLYDLVDRKDKIKYISDNNINRITFQVYSNPDNINELTRKISTNSNYKKYERVVHIDQTLVSNVITNLTMTLV
jgi:hypothetical protein